MGVKWAEMTPRERDALVAEKVMGQRFRSEWNKLHNDTIPCYTTDISAAWEVVQWAIEQGWEPHIDYFEKALRKGYEVTFGHFSEDAQWAIADTAPEAICKAALKAVGVDVE